MAASEELHRRFFTGKLSDSGKLYQQLELEHLNQGREEGDETCMSVLWFYNFI